MMPTLKQKTDIRIIEIVSQKSNEKRRLTTTQIDVTP